MSDRVICLSHGTRQLRPLFVAIIALAALWAPATASASCAFLPGGESGWETADAVFVGTVTDVANGDRWATVSVEEIWKGPDQPAEVVVRGGPEGNVASSVDRTYLVGVRYLFAVSIADGQLTDSACSPTVQTDTIDLDAVRPEDTRQPAGGAAPTAGGGPDFSTWIGPVLVVAVVGGLLLATVLLARRRDG